MLEHSVDVHNGIYISVGALQRSPDKFQELLTSSVRAWTLEGRRAVWLQLPVGSIHLAPCGLSCGFSMHHAVPDYLMMARWLPVDEKNKIPDFATCHLGVGGVVINDKGEILVVTEQYAHRSAGWDMWKVPGGSMDLGEDVATAAIREVSEETGIACEFVKLLGFRHMHGYQFGRDDIYFIVLLRPCFRQRGSDPVPERGEIEKCAWMPVETFSSFKHIASIQQEIARIALGILSDEFGGFAHVPVAAVAGSSRRATLYRPLPRVQPS